MPSFISKQNDMPLTFLENHTHTHRHTHRKWDVTQYANKVGGYYNSEKSTIFHAKLHK